MLKKQTNEMKWN